MMRDIILDYIRKLIKNDTIITEHTPLVSAMVLDSLAVMELDMFVEEETGVVLKPYDSLADIMKQLKNK